MNTDIKTIWIDLNEELYAFILGKIKDIPTAQDLHQEVFIKVQTNMHQLQHTAKLTSWVYQITRNTIMDHFRKQKKEKIGFDTLDLPEDDRDNFEYSKLTNCIHQKIDKLSAQHKEVIVMTAFKDYSQKELATHLKMSYSGTKSRVQKAREILKENMLECPNVASDSSGKLLDFEKDEE
ncbi:sigma-70 family RNA polymerase sigma factor [Aquimarina sp. 2-A2]|uniref:sigma-70 family RNA polymerase sigma factor n=1 Tax=Aquimarina sp. 2-A2 TaxID=3382644 RepID=UPI00387F0BCB